MSGYLRVEIENIESVTDAFDALDEQIDRASVRAVNKTAKWAAREVARSIAADDRVPLRALYKASTSRRHRKRVQFYLADRRRGDAAVWVGYNPIKASYLGALRKQRRGASAGKHFYERAFVATMRSGHRGVYLRRGKSRTPIDEQYAPLESAERNVDTVSRRIPARLADVLAQELNYEVNVRGNR